MFLRSLGFETLNVNPSILIYQWSNGDITHVTLINVYVNDFLLVAKDQKLVNWIKKSLKGEYNIKNLDKVNTIIS